jgi:hypothetical protein
MVTARYRPGLVHLDRLSFGVVRTVSHHRHRAGNRLSVDCYLQRMGS